MIVYNSQRWRTLLGCRGSVLPKACAFALCPSIVALILKVLETEGILAVSSWQFSNSIAWSAFMGTVGFAFIFRTSQCYGRFDACASSAFALKSELFAGMCLLQSFIRVSKKPQQEVWVFRDKLIHLFSMMHSLALAALSDMSHNEFVIIDIDNVPKQFLHALKICKPTERVELVYQWINNLIVKELDSGLLNIPPPILTRVFQELDIAMREYHHALEIMSIPFPFPYSQACLVLLLVVYAFLPFMIQGMTQTPLGALVITFFTSSMFTGLEFISSQLDNPFGDDLNDLPVTDLNNDFNQSMLAMLHPSVDCDFELKSYRPQDVEASRSWHQLCEPHTGDADEQDDPTGDIESTYAGAEFMVPTIVQNLSIDENTQSYDVPAMQVSVDEVDLELQQEVKSMLSRSTCDQLLEAQSAEPPWMLQFMHSQRKYEEDVLARLDAIVQALKDPAVASPQQTPPLERLADKRSARQLCCAPSDQKWRTYIRAAEPSSVSPI